MIEYDPKHWRSHFFDIRGSMVREIAYRVLTVGITGIVVSVSETDADSVLEPVRNRRPSGTGVT